jgi:hypothetical protein
MEYKDFFSPSTLAKLDKQSAENLKQMLGDKTLMQTMVSSQQLLGQIAKAEAPYKDKLEKLAIDIVKELYPIIDEEGITIDAKIVSMSDVNKSLDESISPESRRRIINSITQGAAVRGSFAFYLFKEHLDEIDPSLVEKYNEIMKNTFGVYDDENAIAMFLAMLAQGHKAAGGSSKVIIKEEQSGITIRARAINFPMLVHEIVKGLFELISLQGFKGSKEQNQAVVDKVDVLKNEPYDLKYGKFIYDALRNIAVNNNAEPRTIPYFFAEVYKMDDEEFIEFVENSILGKLTSEQERWIKITIREIENDLKADSTGLDEIKINDPNKLKDVNHFYSVFLNKLLQGDKDRKDLWQLLKKYGYKTNTSSSFSEFYNNLETKQKIQFYKELQKL